MTGRLAGKVAIVTGSGGAIGSACARAFAAQGANVVGVDIDAEAARAVASGNDGVVALGSLDLSRAEDCRSTVEQTLQLYGRVDVLVNNAGRPSYGQMTEPDDSHWHATITSELDSVFAMTHAAWNALAESSGAIVNMASVAGWASYRALAGAAHCAAKGGVLAITRQFATEGREHGIRANSISPGTIETPAVLRKAEDADWARAMLVPIMAGRFGRPDEVAAVALFLASDESAFVNAADIRVDGGTLGWL